MTGISRSQEKLSVSGDCCIHGIDDPKSVAAPSVIISHVLMTNSFWSIQFLVDRFDIRWHGDYSNQLVSTVAKLPRSRDLLDQKLHRAESVNTSSLIQKALIEPRAEWNTLKYPGWTITNSLKFHYRGKNTSHMQISKWSKIWNARILNRSRLLFIMWTNLCLSSSRILNNVLDLTQ
jgi:hypothetical protein